MKVKLVKHTFSKTFEQDVNDIIKNKRVIDIKYSIALLESGDILYTALIMYEEYHM